MNANIFTTWVEQDLLPKLPAKSVFVIHASPAAPQDAVDNATFHKRFDTLEMIEKAGHIALFLPPYYPDLNPIEQKWVPEKL